MISDVTEHKEAEEALHASEKEYRLLADNMLDGIWKTDMDLVFTYVNSAVYRMLGYTPEEWIGTGLSDYCDRTQFEEMRGIAEKEVRKLPNAEGFVFETEIIRKDGSVKSLGITGRVLVDNDNRPIGFQGMARDITLQKQNEEELRKSEKKYRELFDSSRDAIMTLFPPDWKFTSANRTTIELFGARDEQEFCSMSPWEISPERQPDGEPSAIQSMRAIETAMQEGSHLFEWTHRRIDGKSFPASVLLNRVELEGKTGLQATVRDVSGQKHLEDQLRQTQKLEAIGQLAGGVAHDFNNLLTVINGYSQIVHDRLPKDSPLRGDVADIIGAGERATNLTRQLLAFSRRQTLQTKPLDLNKLMRDFNKMVIRLIGEDIKIELLLAPDLGTIMADPGQIEQVILNLAVNARDAMPAGGQLTIETANITLDESYTQSHRNTKPGHYVMLAIADTGCGMNKETQEHLFEPFFTTKEVGYGTGLGLSTVYGIVKQHGGNVWVYSEPGKGTTFKVFLPLRKSEAPLADKIVAPEPVPRGSETILLVEDEASVRELVTNVLEKYGYTVLSVSAPAEAVALFAENPERIDLFVTDIILPEEHGTALYERLLSMRSPLKVLFISGYSADAFIAQDFFQPGVQFLEKPFRAEALGRKVREVLDADGGQDETNP